MPVTAAAISAGAGILQSAIGAIQQGSANKKLKKLFKQRKTFETPAEIFDILNATQYNAQSGYDAETLDYLTNQADRSFATNTGTALRLGADPNVIAGLDDKYLQDIMGIGSNNAMLQLQNFDKFLNAKQLVATNKEAEYQSEQDLLKDQMAMYGLKAQAGSQNINSGVNLITNGLSNYGASQLYKDYLDKIGKTQPNNTVLPFYEPGRYTPGSGIYADPNQEMIDKTPRWGG